MTATQDERLSSSVFNSDVVFCSKAKAFLYVDLHRVTLMNNPRCTCSLCRQDILLSGALSSLELSRVVGSHRIVVEHSQR